MFLRTKFCLIAILFGLLVAGCNPTRSTQPAQPAQSIVLSDCQLSAPGMQIRTAARCGTLSVYEDRLSEQGPKIDLNIAVIPAVSRNPAPDPLFFLTGGPGQAATESYLSLSAAFERINQKREIILVDQRGTGKSGPLGCKSDTGDPTDIEEQDLIPWLEACLEATTSRPEFYTTPIAMDDLDQVRQALGYQKINLYGVSYGSRAALTYLAAYPDHVRSVILDGVVPQDEKLGLEVAKDAQRALDLVFERCQNEKACHQAFPNVRAEFAQLLDQLGNAPVTVSVAHPVTGEDTEVLFTRVAFASAIRLLSYAPETAALLPLLVHQAAQSQEFSALAAQYLIVSGQLTDTISNGMGFSVLCAEDVPFMTREEAVKANANTYLGNQQTDELFNICQVWPKGAVPPNFKQPVQSDLPVLVLSGEVDPVTPPSNGEQVAQTLPNSMHLVVPGQGHNVIHRGCLSRLATSFVEQGSLEGLDVTCVQQIVPFQFFINYSGPTP